MPARRANAFWGDQMDYMASKKFRGTLSSGESSLAVAFAVRIDDAGEAQFEFDPIPIDKSSAFIQTAWDPPGNEFGEFKLDGVAEDGATFFTDNMIFTTLGRRSTSTELSFNPAASCSESRLSIQGEKREGPVAKLLLKGFRSMRPLVAQTKLGAVHLLGPDSLDSLPSPNSMSGRFQVDGGSDIVDVKAWREEVDRLFDHLLNIMSFASGTMLHAPLSEFIHDGQVELVALSQTKQEAPYMPPFSHRGLGPIFQRAAETHFQPAFPVEKLHYAIAWYCMSSSYAEANLITAMTVLENLISSNLSDDEILIQKPADFERLRKKISAAAKDYFAGTTEDAEQRKLLVADINDKLNDINRRTLKQKIDILAGRWGMSLEGLSEDQIKGAKKARDHVVHRGHYESARGGDELFGHLLVARELVVRFILTALRFEGSYRSYLGGIGDREFKLAPSLGPAE